MDVERRNDETRRILEPFDKSKGLTRSVHLAISVYLGSNGSHALNWHSRLGTRRFPTSHNFASYLKTVSNLRTGMAGSKVFRISNGKGLRKRVGPVLVNG